MALKKLGALLAMAAVASPLTVNAQALTAEDILALLQAQQSQLSGGLGPSRALEFVTESNPTTPDDTGMSMVAEVPGDALAASTEGSAIPEEMVIDLTIFFEFDSALLKTESKSQVDALCTAIETNEEAKAAMSIEADGSVIETAASDAHGTYQIIGHTDASGSVQYNLVLSQARADEVVRYMVRECGIDGNLLQAVGMGEARLKDPANPRADANRRVEIQVVL